jgi:hypothetical protein
LPSHDPSSPQVAGVLAAQTEGTLGLPPDGTKAQSPRELGRLHALQVSPQAEVQQIPSTQNPVWHSRSQLQDSALPLDLLGVLDEQVLGGWAVCVVPGTSEVLTSFLPASRVPPPSTSTCAYVAVLQAARPKTAPNPTTLRKTIARADDLNQTRCKSAVIGSLHL